VKLKAMQAPQQAQPGDSELPRARSLWAQRASLGAAQLQAQVPEPCVRQE